MEGRQQLEVRLAAARDRFEALGPEDRSQFFRAINHDLAPTVEVAWQLLMQLPYQGSYLRKGFRAPRHPACTAMERGKWLSDWIALNAKSSRDLASIALGTGLGYGTHHVAGVLLAAAIDAGTAESAAVYGALAGSDTGRHTITALLCCSRPEAWAEVERLLLAAQRQEGLRQVILETVDLAHPEAFRRMLRLIRAEKLTRFASTARAIAVWFGMTVDSAEEKKMNGLLDTLIECLDDPERRQRALASESTDNVYLALWAHAFEDAMTAIEVATPLLRDPHVDRRYAAVHLLGQLALPEAVTALADSLADPEPRVALHAASAFPKRSAWYFPRVNCPDAFERMETLLARTREPADRAALAVKLLQYRADRPFSRFESHLPMFDPDGRIELLKSIQTAATKADGARPIVIALLGDASAHVREVAFKTIPAVGMRTDDVPAVERLLSRKASDLRRGAISLLLKLPEPHRRASADRLAASADALMRQAGLEMLDSMRAAEAPAPPPTLEDGLGLFNPSDRTAPAKPRAGLAVQLASDASRRLLDSLGALVAQHRETTAHWSIGERKIEELLGNIMYFPAPKSTNELPLREVWEAWWRSRPAELRDADGLELLRALCTGGGAFGRNTAGGSKLDLPFSKIVFGILQWMLMEPLPANTPDFLMDAMETTFATAPAESVLTFSGTGVWMKICLDCLHMRPELWTGAHWHRLWPLLRWRGTPAQMGDLLQAHRMGAASDADILAHLLAAPHPQGTIRNWDLQRLTRRKPDDLMVRYPELTPLVARARDRILEVELERGDLPTAASGKALALSCVYGARLALRILKALGKEPLARGWAHNNEGKATVLSHLLRVCLPAENDTPADFRKLAEDFAIPTDRLIDMAVYAPQWASYVEHATGVRGLESAAFWIHAHTKDRQWTIDEQIRELWFAQVSESTPLSLENLLDGAVDVNWFHEVYGTLGTKHWDAVLDSAKYASGGGGHKRAEQFALALLGSTKATELAARIREKRHQDSVRALGLVPLPHNAKTARTQILERYEVMQAFLKGSKKFGAQQQATDKLAVTIGLENLARTAGFPDAQRLTWAMEAEAVADLKKGPVEVVEDALPCAWKSMRWASRNSQSVRPARR